MGEELSSYTLSHLEIIVLAKCFRVCRATDGKKQQPWRRRRWQDITLVPYYRYNNTIKE